MQLGEKTQDSSHTVKPMKCLAGRELLYLFYFFKNLYEELKEINIDKAPYCNHDCLLELAAAPAAAKKLQSCPTLCDPIDGSPPGSPIPGFTASDFTFTTRHIHNWALFSLCLSLFIYSGAISLFFSSSILGTYRHGRFIHSVSHGM